MEEVGFREEAEAMVEAVLAREWVEVGTVVDEVLGMEERVEVV